MEPDELLPAFAARLGIQGLSVHDGACALEIDGMPVDIAPVPGDAALAVCAVLQEESSSPSLGPSGFLTV